MKPVQITVRGSHTVRLAPEQATVYANVGADGPAPEPVFDSVAAAMADVTRSLQARNDAERPTVTKFAVDQVRRGSHRPFNRDGEQLPLVHTATASVTATFTDFDDLAAWVGWSAAVPGLGITGIEWALTDSRRLRAERKARQKAVRDARRRAQDYADALDLGPVRIRTISDPGLGGSWQPKVMMANAVGAPAGGFPEISLRPAEVEIEAQIEAIFTVG